MHRLSWATWLAALAFAHAYDYLDYFGCNYDTRGGGGTQIHDFNPGCTDPSGFASRVQSSQLVAQFNFNENIEGGPPYSGAGQNVVVNKGHVLPQGTVAFPEIHINPAFWCQKSAGLCLNASIAATQPAGWPASTDAPTHTVPLFDFANQAILVEVPFVEESWTIEMWYRTLPETHSANAPSNGAVFAALTSCNAPMSVDSSFKLSDCGDNAVFRVNTRGFFATHGSQEAVASVSNPDKTPIWDGGANYASPYKQPMYGTRTPKNPGLHHYVTTIHARDVITSYPDAYKQTGLTMSKPQYLPAEVFGAALRSFLNDAGANHQIVNKPDISAGDSIFSDGQLGANSGGTAFFGQYEFHEYLDGTEISNSLSQEDTGRGYESNWSPQVPYAPNFEPPLGVRHPNRWRTQIANPANAGSYSTLPMRFTFGSYNSPGSNKPFWEGEIRMFAMYRQLLTCDEIQQNYNAGPPNSPPITPNLAVDVPFCAASVSVNVPAYDPDIRDFQCAQTMTITLLSLPTAAQGTLSIGGVHPSSAPTTLAPGTVVTFSPAGPAAATTTFSLSYSATDGQYVSVPGTLSFTLDGDRPPVGAPISVTAPNCIAVTPVFGLTVSDPDNPGCAQTLTIKITSIPAFNVDGVTLYVSTNGGTTFSAIDPNALPAGPYPSTSKWKATVPPSVGTTYTSVIHYVVSDGLLQSATSTISIVALADTPPVAFDTNLVFHSCQSPATFSLSAHDTDVTACNNPQPQISFVSPQPATSLGQIQYDSTPTGQTATWTPITASPTTVYDLTTIFRYVPPSPLPLAPFSVAFPFYATDGDASSPTTHVNVNFQVDTNYPPAVPANAMVHLDQCNGGTLVFPLPISANLSAYFGCASPATIEFDSLPSSSSQGTFAVSTITGAPFVPVDTYGTLFDLFAGFSIRFQTPVGNINSYTFSLSYQLTGNGLPSPGPLTAPPDIQIVVDSSKIGLPVAIPAAHSVFASKGAVCLGMLLILADTILFFNLAMDTHYSCPNAASLVLTTRWYIRVPLSTLGQSPTYAGRLLVCEPSAPGGVLDLVTLPGLQTTVIGGVLTYVLTNPTGCLAYQAPPATNDPLQVIAHDGFDFAAGFDGRVSSSFVHVAIDVLNDMMGVSDEQTVLENTATPVLLSGVASHAVPLSSVTFVVDSLPSNGTLLLSGSRAATASDLPVRLSSRALVVQLSPNTTALQTVPGPLEYLGPLNVSGPAMDTMSFHLEASGALMSPGATHVFNVAPVNLAPWWQADVSAPYVIVHGVLGTRLPNGGVGPLTVGAVVPIQLVIHDPDPLLLPFGIAIDAVSTHIQNATQFRPHRFNLCCANSPFLVLTTGAQAVPSGPGASLVSFEALPNVANGVLQPLTFTVGSDSGQIQLTVNDNDPSHPHTGTLVLTFTTVAPPVASSASVSLPQISLRLFLVCCWIVMKN